MTVSGKIADAVPAAEPVADAVPADTEPADTEPATAEPTKEFIDALQSIDHANVLADNICAHMNTVTEDMEAAATAHVLARLNIAVTLAEANCAFMTTQLSLIAGSLKTLYESLNALDHAHIPTTTTYPSNFIFCYLATNNILKNVQ
ncbi:hypothetical protein FBU31_002867 [Coemansia sp. 'formosensis']|nr:hypothetical protein FBU31_002867 [Coemansia sp. 'formosensis']